MSKIEDSEETNKQATKMWVDLEQEEVGRNPFFETGRKVIKVSMNEDGFRGAGRDVRRIQSTTDGP